MLKKTTEQAEEADSTYSNWRFALGTIAAFWTVYLLSVIVRALLSGDFVGVMINRLPGMLTGLALTFAVYFAIRSVRDNGMKKRAIVAGVASLGAALLQGVSFMVATTLLMQSNPQEYRVEAREGAVIVQKGGELRIERNSGEPLTLTLPQIDEMGWGGRARVIADAAVVWLFFFAAWSATYIARISAGQVAGARRQAAEAEAAAQAAQVRALRYQVNPHFLFNTLNSLSSLVMTGRNERAESMLMALSTFFRTSLSLDPNESVSLNEEIDLQRLYLDIEKARFPERLQVDIDVSKAAGDVQVPALILQPLIENAIKYGVAVTREKVTVSIRARRLDDDRVQIDVTNTLPDPSKARATTAGTGTGLTNVTERLQAHFGSRADCRFGPRGDTYRVSVAIPANRENDA